MEYKILDKVPEGWVKMKGATNHPRGAMWYNNGQPRFSGMERINENYKQALVKNEE